MNIKDYLNKSLLDIARITNMQKNHHYDFFEKFGEKEWINLTFEMLQNSDKFPLDVEIANKMYRKYTKYIRNGEASRYDLQDLSIWILENWEEYIKNLHPEMYQAVKQTPPKPQKKIIITPSTFDDLFEFV